MTALFKKLNFKDQAHILVLNAPASLDQELEDMRPLTQIILNPSKLKEIEFVLSFVKNEQEIERTLETTHAKLKGDPILWLCYPKASSKKYSCTFNRDNGWTKLGELGWEPVRQVAIDEDWSALRFRKVEHIKSITRRASFALTTEAKKRTTQKNK